MFRFIVPVQALAVFSFCLAWDRLYPDRDYRLHYYDDEKNYSPTGNKLELAENFTQFLQRKNTNKNTRKKLEGDPKNYNLKKEPYKIWPKRDENHKKIATTEPKLSTEKYEYMDYETNVFTFSTKTNHDPIKNTLFPVIKTITSLDTDLYEDGDVKLLNLLEEPDNMIAAIRRFAPAASGHDLSKDNRLHDKTIGKHKEDALFSLQKIFEDMSEEGTASSKSQANVTNTPKIEINLNELKDIENETSKNDTITLHDVMNISHTDKAPKNTEKIKPHKLDKKTDKKKKETKTSAELIDDHRQKFEKILNRESQIMEILKKQTELLEQVAKVLEAKQKEKGREAVRVRAAAEDFESILTELQKKTDLLDEGTNMTQAAVDSVKEKLKLLDKQKEIDSTVTSSMQPKMLATIKTVIDEIEVRNALKNDPYVQRILKMAKRKRAKYLKEASKLNSQ